MKTLNDWLHPSKKVPPGPFDMFVFHSQWRYQEVQKVMPTSAVTITVLRDPVDTFESGYSYFGRAPKVLHHFKYSPTSICESVRHFLIIQLFVNVIASGHQSLR